MLDIGWSEMAMIALLALIVIGPKDLPKVMRSIGQWTRKARNVAREFQSGLDDMMRESELDEARKTVERTRNFDVGREVESEVDPEGSIREEAGELDRSAREDTSSASGGVVERESPTAPGHSVDAGKPASDKGGSAGKGGATKSGASKGGATSKSGSSKSGTAKGGTSKGGASSRSKTAAAAQSSPKTSDTKSGGTKSGTAKSGGAKTGGAKSGGAKTGSAKTGGSKTSARKTSGSKASG